MINTNPRSHPVFANADGSVNAPVPTIKLNTNIKPIWREDKRSKPNGITWHINDRITACEQRNIYTKMWYYPWWIHIIASGATVANRLITLILWHYETPTQSFVFFPFLLFSLSLIIEMVHVWEQQNMIWGNEKIKCVKNKLNEGKYTSFQRDKFKSHLVISVENTNSLFSTPHRFRKKEPKKMLLNMLISLFVWFQQREYRSTVHFLSFQFSTMDIDVCQVNDIICTEWERWMFRSLLFIKFQLILRVAISIAIDCDLYTNYKSMSLHTFNKNAYVNMWHLSFIIFKRYANSYVYYLLRIVVFDFAWRLYDSYSWTPTARRKRMEAKKKKKFTARRIRSMAFSTKAAVPI